jgi:DEAD/DEAH box helicase domain-containing protein
VSELDRFLGELTRRETAGEVVIHLRTFPPRSARTRPLVPSLPEALQDILTRRGIAALYAHQAEGIAAIRDGRHTLVATGTASGKSLVYALPILETCLGDPQATALCLFPIKALEQDQLGALRELIPPGSGITAAILDGDTPTHERARLREQPPNVLISNPDLLHLSLLPYHPQWKGFFERLRYVVVDELHTYRGVFGSHVAHVLRRLRRVAAHYGASPQFIACSATISNPGELAGALTGLPFTVLAEDGSPQRGKRFALVGTLRSPYAEATALLLRCVEQGLKAIAFTKARKITELMAMWAQEQAPRLAERIRAYRAGYMPEERRAIEAGLFREELWGVISTSALELGIDVGGLDACILVGYPGSITSTWQRGGRVGRGSREALIVLVALPDALDQYFLRHPDQFFARGFEPAIVDPGNRQILQAHLTAAAAELPVVPAEPVFAGLDLTPALEALLKDGRIAQSASGAEYYSRVRYPQRQISIRSIGEALPILDEQNRSIGTVDGMRALTECHPGAIYLHQGRQYAILSLDLAQKAIRAAPVEADYYTRALTEKDTEVLEVLATRDLPGCRARLGRLKVTTRVTGYEKRRIHGQDKIGTYPLDLPPQTFETVGLWLEVPEEVARRTREAGRHVMGALHAAEHVAIALLPLFALCDRHDVGGISTPFHAQVGGPAIFVYDGTPGGIGLSERGFEVLEAWLRETIALLQDCPCEAGCPSCVQSPKCGSGNKPLDKAGASLLLRALLGGDGQEAPAGQPEAPRGEPAKAALPAEATARQQPPAGTGTLPPKVLVLDVETQRSAEEVGGWDHRDKMGLAVAVTHDLGTGISRVYLERDAPALLADLASADLVVGFNVRRFDYGVLQPYASLDLNALPTLDMLEEVHSRLGFRLSLSHLAEETLGTPKTADGLQSLAWWKAGEVGKVVAYCTADAELTGALYRFGQDHGYLLYRDREGRPVRVPVDFGEKSVSNPPAGGL